jgi:hypothetical protein
LATVSGDLLKSKVKSLLLRLRPNLHPLPLMPPRMLLLNLPPMKVKPLLRKSLPSLRLLLSSTLSGPTPSNKLDGLNKELPILRTSLTKLLSTNLGKRVRPYLTNMLPLNSRATAPTVLTVVPSFLTRLPPKRRLMLRPPLVLKTLKLLLLVMPSLMANLLRLRMMPLLKRAKLELKLSMHNKKLLLPLRVMPPRRFILLSPWLMREDKTTTN